MSERPAPLSNRQELPDHRAKLWEKLGLARRLSTSFARLNCVLVHTTDAAESAWKLAFGPLHRQKPPTEAIFARKYASGVSLCGGLTVAHLGFSFVDALLYSRRRCVLAQLSLKGLEFSEQLVHKARYAGRSPPPGGPRPRQVIWR